MISLYDYLGRAAGPDLGKQVAYAAAKAGIKSEIREVSHVGYKGPIMLYPRTFLDNFFGGGLNESTSEKQLEIKSNNAERRMDKMNKSLPSVIGQVVGQIEFAQDTINRKR